MKKNNVTLLGANEPLLIAIKTLKNKINIKNIISNKKNHLVQKFCINNKINFVSDIKFAKMESLNKYKIYKSDFALSFSYPKKISKNTINLFDNRIYNFHPANLPFYRGNLPTIWPILNGDLYAYYTLHVINNNFDEGPIIAKSKIKIYKNDTGISLYNRLTKKLPNLINKNLNFIIENNLNFTKQDKKNAHFYKKKIPSNGIVSLNWKGQYIEKFVRALYSDKHTPAVVFFNNEYLKLYKVKFLKNINNKKNRKLILKCNDGYIEVLKYEKK